MNRPPDHKQMNLPPEQSHTEVLRIRLAMLRTEHRDLDLAIQAIHDAGGRDVITLQRLKKQKLALKDKIAVLEDELTPDIIA